MFWRKLSKEGFIRNYSACPVENFELKNLEIVKYWTLKLPFWTLLYFFWAVLSELSLCMPKIFLKIITFLERKMRVDKFHRSLTANSRILAIIFGKAFKVFFSVSRGIFVRKGFFLEKLLLGVISQLEKKDFGIWQKKCGRVSKM